MSFTMAYPLLCAVILLAGVSGESFSPYIAKGKDISINDAQYMLSLAQNNRHICGAVVISEYWALTSAKCVFDEHSIPKPSLSIRSGSSFKDREGRVHNIVQRKKHPLYNPTTLEYDFALLKVVTPFPYSSRVRILPSCYTEPSDGAEATIIGWGKTEDGEYADVLQKGDVYIVARSECQTLHKHAPQRVWEPIYEAKMICAQSSGVGACKGDEGGPLMVDNALVGITSWNVGCANPLYPEVYGNIGNVQVRRWIANLTGR